MSSVPWGHVGITGTQVFKEAQIQLRILWECTTEKNNHATVLHFCHHMEGIVVMVTGLASLCGGGKVVHQVRRGCILDLNLFGVVQNQLDVEKTGHLGASTSRQKKWE